MNYAVGQVLYLLMKKEKSVVPVQVIEKLLRTTLEGETISYIVELPTKSRDKMLLDKLESSVYTSLEDVKKVMVNNAKNTIDQIIEKSYQKANDTFPDATRDTNLSITTDLEQILVAENNDMLEGQKVEVDLGGGLKGNIVLSSDLVGG